jgi:hypothetical protein
MARLTRAVYRQDSDGRETFTVEERGKVLHGRHHFDRVRHTAYAQYAKRTHPRPQPRPPTTRPRGAGRPRARRLSRSCTPSGDSGDPDPEPEPSRRRRLNSRDEIERWLAERRRVLSALQTERQLRLEERAA